MPHLSDQELVAACLQGKESAYALLVERHAGRLYRIAARICRHPQDAEDAVQETLLQAVRDLSSWRPTAPLEAWLVTIAVRTATKLDQRSNRIAGRTGSLDFTGRDGSPIQLQDPSNDGDPLAAAVHGDLGDRLTEAIARLPEKHRQAVALRFLEGLSPKEIGELLGIPERTVRTNLRRGLIALREQTKEL